MNAALTWFKSSYSTEQGGNCVEVAATPTAIHIRDSKDPDGPQLAVSPAAWSAFTARVRRAPRGATLEG
ncbi:DUF397 domain-containing protein [Streptomyces purpurogeneiscleroticus]|uniref:DUF397 domain-containing protein n=1 Tax=Streptomyces purpurogeneiscleroticus TaxID=68259 RepID=UPI001CBB957F|nr:DUF397 domain-containing protein [Streptomyces purpurogeneiscleroticus]MBZ4019390.1 DUF397 domain-containing protein [Streptomyces purpurogeneiscleroticus]